MTRKKKTLAYIANDSDRRACFRKRKKGLIKKVSELSTLCGVDACAVIYSQYDSEPEVWPSASGAEAVLSRFQRMNTMDRTRKMVNQESYTRQRIFKAEEKLRRVLKENKRKEMERFMFMNLYGDATLDQLNLKEASVLGFVIEQTLRDITSQMETLKLNKQIVPAPAEAAPAPPFQLEEVNFYIPALPPPLQPDEVKFDFPELGAAPPLPEMAMEELEGFPWDLLQSTLYAGLDDDCWDDGMEQASFFNNEEAATSGTKSFSSFFDNEASTSGTQPGTGGTNFWG
ncbi:hypothetical protein ACS0TY_020244 [Phlomoides rotata]